MKEKVRIVAEGAQGYEGSVRQAQLLVRAAAAGGADFIKLQLVFADELATPDYKWHGLFSQLEMSDVEWKQVGQEARNCGIQIACDVFGTRSLELAQSIGATAIKIHSTDFFNTELMSAARDSGVETWFSIGGITLDEVSSFIDPLSYMQRARLTLLYGFQAEPTVDADNHLRRLSAISKRFPGLPLGFMDHAAAGSDSAAWLGILALPFGISLIEKHITIGRRLSLEDSVSAADAQEFFEYVSRIRAAESALGSDSLGGTDAEMAYRGRALKVVVATRTLAAGHKLAIDDIQLLRAPRSDGDQPILQREQAIGRTLRRSVAINAMITLNNLS